MIPRIFVAIACHNRRAVAALCLPTMRASIAPEDKLVLYNDGSAEYDGEWLRQFTPDLVADDGDGKPIGIQAQRRMHLRHFLASPPELTHCYFSDHDVLMDPSWRENALRLQEKYGGVPICLYDTEAHRRIPGNTLEDDPANEVIRRRWAPGVSYLLTREHVERIAPHLPRLDHFDWTIPEILGGFAVSRTSYCDHIGWGGCRHPVNAGLDQGDRALNPMPWLVAKRAEIVSALSHA